MDRRALLLILPSLMVAGASARADRKGREALAALAWSYDAVAVTRAFTAPTRLAPAAGPAGD